MDWYGKKVLEARCKNIVNINVFVYAKNLD